MTLSDGYLIYLWQRVMKIFQEVFRGQNVTPIQHMAMVAINDLRETTQRRLAHYQKIEPSNIHGNLKKFADRKLISINTDPAN